MFYFDLDLFFFFTTTADAACSFCALVAGDGLTDAKSATLVDVLEVAGLLDAYNDYLQMSMSADAMFKNGNTRGAADVINQLWYSPTIVPALMLYECYYFRELVLTNWRGPWRMYYTAIDKPQGGKRPLVIPSKDTRLAMGVVNSLLQTSCSSWSNGTVGFRPQYGTQHALQLIKDQAAQCFSKYGQAYICSFDIVAAFNSVRIQQLFNTLGLGALPHPVKRLIWEWHNSKVLSGLGLDWAHPNAKAQHVDLGSLGLPQGFSYSPTLFAFYLDNILVKNTNWVAYADNVAAVFGSRHEAQAALRDANSKLAHAGFRINQNSLMCVAFSPAGCSFDSMGTPVQAKALTTNSRFVWLGHSLDLPTLKVSFGEYKQLSITQAPARMTRQDWANLLHSTYWTQQALLSGWRKI